MLEWFYLPRLFIMRPHSQHTNDFFLNVYLIDETLLNIDSSLIGTDKIPDQLFVRRWILEGIICKNGQYRLSLLL